MSTKLNLTLDIAIFTAFLPVAHPALTVENITLIPDVNEFSEGTTEPGEHPEGGEDHNAASLSRGRSEVGTALAEVTGITSISYVSRDCSTG